MLLTHGMDCKQVIKGLDQHQQCCNKDFEEEAITIIFFTSHKIISLLR